MRKLLIFVLLTLGCVAFSQQVVCIDPGHPSEVGEGTTGKKLTEMHAVWVEALLLRDRLQALGYKVVLTKKSEKEFVKNRARAEIANKAHADLMVRLHCDASNGSGFASYSPTQAGRSAGVSGPSAQVIKASQKCARLFHEALAAGLRGKLRDNGLKSDLATAVGAKQGALTGSIFSKVPVVLVEMVVLTNAKDEAFLLGKEGQEAMADALAAGVVAALKK
jgi:N-acetylmuramoyl-L-alanine amidase